MIEIRSANKAFGKNIVLRNVNLAVKKGEIIAIIGPSGAGKSTLLRSINLLEVPDSGRLRVDDIEIDCARFSQREMLSVRRKSAMVFQHFNLFVNKNVLENVCEALVVVQKLPVANAKKIALEKLAQVGLASRANAYAYELSGGQQQRVAIARALALNTPILLFDEPTSALDIELIGEVLDAIRGIEDRTMLLVTHELSFAKAIADRIIFMDKGEIIEENRGEAFFKDAKSARVREFLAKVARLGVVV